MPSIGCNDPRITQALRYSDQNLIGSFTVPDPNHPEDEKLLIERALRLHPDDQELQKRAAANEYPSRFRK